MDDHLTVLLAGDEYVYANYLRKALPMTPAGFVKFINENNIPYYSEGYTIDEIGEICSDGIYEEYLPSKRPIEIGIIGDIKFHEIHIRDAAEKIEALQPLLQEVNSRPAQDLRTDDSREQSQSIVVAPMVGVEAEVSGAPSKETPNMTDAQSLVDKMSAQRPRPGNSEIAKAVDAQYPGITHPALGGLLAKEGDRRNPKADSQRGRRARGHSY